MAVNICTITHTNDELEQFRGYTKISMQSWGVYVEFETEAFAVPWSEIKAVAVSVEDE